MNTQQLKEVAQLANELGGIANYLRGKQAMHKFLNEFTPAVVVMVFEQLEAAERERDELRKTLIATQGGATEAINDAIRLKAELARLKAAVCQPVAWRVVYNNACDSELYANEQEAIRKCRELDENGFLDVRVEPLRTTAQAAVVPTEMTMSDAIKANISTEFMDGANWMLQQVIDMGAQQQQQQQRAEAAEANLAELKKQEPVGWMTNVEVDELHRGIAEEAYIYKSADAASTIPLYARPEPAVSLAELVEHSANKDASQIIHLFDGVYDDRSRVWSLANDVWDACHAAILRNIEEQSK